ncbi:glycosyltransferase family 9 protein [Thiohalophilus thiocyanatoxydans]|uniref:ADP-heptose:LPS heptosyltransferase n=1 Tax=Thiohalophilus thiocyanatoxydans TaxID=381308 RepID=A0A4R8IKL4_9GAMM|nr:glycosyltransferase family 9 protein [Thiohalophilus thiocyanatoxydans]TDX99569.1 ADP-heptose:LPS heptosyltransferase [Thiohalophilus thiocyanatoxydans]
MSRSRTRILIVRNDKLGDFMLSLPVFAALKSNFENCELHALVPSYTRDMAAMCPWIDQIVLDPGQSPGSGGLMRLSRELRRGEYDAVITLFSTTRIALATLLAGIPIRFAPATKIAQVFYNRRITQRRSRSLKPEYEYNLDLAYAFLNSLGIEHPTRPLPPYLIFPADELTALKNDFINTHNIPPESRLVFVHPGSGGSANNLSLESYASLIQQLSADSGLHFVLSAGPGEQAGMENVADLLQDVPHTRYISQQGLTAFARHIAIADLFIAGSTGPLHIAGALDVPTVGFYPRRRSSTALRWQTLNSDDKRLTFSPPDSAAEDDMAAIDITGTSKSIHTFIQALNNRQG